MSLEDYILDILVTIVDRDKGSLVLTYAKEAGASGGTIFLGRGTAQKSLMDYLGLGDNKKEIVVILDTHKKIQEIINHVAKKLHFEKPNHGVAYIEGASQIYGSLSCSGVSRGQREEEKMYNAIYTIVEKGWAQEVIGAAQEAGAPGGTVINARGAGYKRAQRVFNMTIEPEKEIVLIIAKEDQTQAIAKAITDRIELDKPATGILYITQVLQTFGMVD
ncbi:MAG: P-II family nitrogen regulator [Tissierellia bacterium]|nr:P-II family nitrogen regulator [Tissierellia bacterium]